MREWLKEARLARNLTQKQVADKIGMTEAYYSMIESGDRQKKMDLTMAIRLSNVLRVTLEEIVAAEEAENDRADN